MSDVGIPFAGQLDAWKGDFDVPELLLAVSRMGRTGRLELTSHSAKKCLHLDDGAIRFASSSSNDDRLGIFLLLKERLTLAELKRLGPRVQPGVRLGTVLVEEGVLGPGELEDAVTEQVRSIVLGLFDWTEATYAFVEEPSRVAETITLSEPTPRLVFDGIERVPSWRRILRGLGSLDARFVTLAGNEDSLRSADLDRASLELLAILSHPKSVEELCRSSDLGDLDVCRRLWAFRALGWIAAATETPDSELDGDLEALGLIFGEPRPGSAT